MAVLSTLRDLPRQGPGCPVLIPLSRRAVRAEIHALARHRVDPLDGLPEFLLRFALLGENRVYPPRRPDRAGHRPGRWFPGRAVLPLHVRVGTSGAPADQVGHLRRGSGLPGADWIRAA